MAAIVDAVKTIHWIFLFCFVAFFTLAVIAILLDHPSDYDECILEYVSGTNNDRAISEIRHSCRRKFPTDS